MVLRLATKSSIGVGRKKKVSKACAPTVATEENEDRAGNSSSHCNNKARMAVICDGPVNKENYITGSHTKHVLGEGCAGLPAKPC